jgi:hypothetical protein
METRDWHKNMERGLAFNGDVVWLLALLDYDSIGRLASCSKRLNHEMTRNNMWRMEVGLTEHSLMLSGYIQRTVQRKIVKRHCTWLSWDEGFRCPPAPTAQYAKARKNVLAGILADESRLIWRDYVPYLAFIRRFAPPTTDQVLRFATRGICGAHSWYKKLPGTQTSPFFVFLNPFAGLSHDGKKYSEKGNDGNVFHYNQRSTVEYRAEYGMLDWTQDDPYGPREFDTETPSEWRASLMLKRPHAGRAVLNLPPCSVAAGWVMLSKCCHVGGSSDNASPEMQRDHEAVDSIIALVAGRARVFEDMQVDSLTVADTLCSFVEEQAGSHDHGAWAWIGQQMQAQRDRMRRYCEPTSRFVGAMEKVLRCWCTNRQREREIAGIVDAVNVQVECIYGRRPHPGA